LFSIVTLLTEPSLKTIQQIEQNIFSNLSWKSISIAYNSVVEIQSGASIIVTLTVPVNAGFYNTLSTKDLYQRSTDRWADYALNKYEPHVRKSLRKSLKSKVSIIPFDELEEYNAFWSSNGLQFDLRIVPVHIKRVKEKKDIAVYFDVDDSAVTDKVKKLGVDFWEKLKILFEDDDFLKDFMGLADEVEDVSGKFIQEFLCNYTDHISYLKSLNMKDKPAKKEDGFLRADLKRKKLFYTQDGVLGFLIKKLKKIGPKYFQTGIVLVRVKPSHLTSYNIEDYLEKYDSELNLFLDKYAEEKGEPKTKSGNLITRIYKF